MSMFDFEQIKELIGSIDNSGITSFEVKGSDGEKLVIKKEVKQEIIAAAAPAAATQTVKTRRLNRKKPFLKQLRKATKTTD